MVNSKIEYRNQQHEKNNPQILKRSQVEILKSTAAHATDMLIGHKVPQVNHKLE